MLRLISAEFHADDLCLCVSFGIVAGEEHAVGEAGSGPVLSFQERDAVEFFVCFGRGGDFDTDRFKARHVLQAFTGVAAG